MDEASIFMEALKKPLPDERAVFLDQACGGNDELRRSVELLLKAHDKAGGFLADSPAPVNATVDQPIAESLGTVIGPYKLIEQIGEGGMGTVWMAQQTEPVKRLVALKLIKAGMDSKQVIARFEAERQALALMDHPNIARVLDAGTTSAGRPYFVMDLVKGVPITKYCDEHHLTPRQRLELFIPVCQAVQHAHQKGIIHRDLKPSNVLVALYDGKPVPKVIDFGVAKAAGPSLTEKTLVTGFGNIVGTLEYMSPEQAEINQLDIDTRSDIYSLGVLLYELLAGSPPFTRKNMEKAGMLEMLRVIREDEPSKPSTKLSSSDALPTLSANRGTEPAKLTRLVRGELDWIVMKALEKDRGRRYETANGFAMDVQRYLADEAVLACPPSTFYRLKKFVRRHKGPVWAASAVLLTLISGIVGTTWQAVLAANRAEGERLAKERAEANFDLANEAVEKYLGTVTNDPDLNQADFNRLRKRLLESAIPFFKKLTAQKSDDPEVEARRGLAYHRLASVREAMGEYEAALQDAEAMQAIFVRLFADFPTVPAHRQGLGSSHHVRARALIHLGRHEEAEVSYRQALAIFEKLVDDFPADRTLSEKLAESHHDLGELLGALGRREQAEKAFRRALELREKAAADFPKIPAYRRLVAQTLNNVGKLLTGMGEREKAEAALRQALDIQQKLVEEFPTETEYRSGLAAHTANLANVLHYRGKRLEAEAAFRRALGLFEKLAADFPTVPKYRDSLADNYNNLGVLFVDMGKGSDAEAAFRQALGIREKLADDFPKVPEYRQKMAQSHDTVGSMLRDQGKHELAEAAYRQALNVKEKLAANFPNVLDYGVSLAGSYCNFGILMSGSDRKEAALDWFQKAIAQLEAVLAKQPRLLGAREFLRNSHGARALTLSELHRPADALPDWQRAAELDDGLQKDGMRLNVYGEDHRWGLAMCLLELGKRPEAEAAYRQAIANKEYRAANFPSATGDAVNLAGRFCNFGVLLRMLDQQEAALDWFQKAIARLEAVLAKEPRMGSARVCLRTSHAERATTLDALTRHAEAVRDWQRAVELDDELAKGATRSDTNGTTDRWGLAHCHLDLGNVMFEQAKWAEAEASYRQAITILEPIVRDFPNATLYRHGLAKNHGMLALVLKRTDRPTEAATEYGLAIDALRELTKKRPNVADYAVDLGGNLCDLGGLLETGGQSMEALDYYRQAIQALTPLVERDPKQSTAREFLRNSHLNRAAVLVDLKRFAEAIPDWDRGIELCDSASRPEYRMGRAKCLARIDPVKAVADAEEVIKDDKVAAPIIYHAAIVHALASATEQDADKREQYAARAVALLQLARARGNFKNKDNIERLKTDTGLDPLRQREDFKQLLRGLERK